MGVFTTVYRGAEMWGVYAIVVEGLSCGVYDSVLRD